MMNNDIAVGSENEWLASIAKTVNGTSEQVASVLEKHGIRAQSTPPRAKKVAFTSLSFSGIKKGTQKDGPFDFEWSDLGPGLWSVMSDRNLRGKSSVMNILSATLRGEFPGKIKADVWKWLDRVEVKFRIENTEYRTRLQKSAGVEGTADTDAVLSRKHGEEWINLYSGSAADGLRTQTENLFLEELGFTKIHGANQSGTAYVHSWAAIASALSITSASNGKALFGELLIDGLPLRLLQLFIGLPWISTMTAAATAAKLFEIDTKRKDSISDHFAGVRARLKVVENEIELSRAGNNSNEQRQKVRAEIAALDQSLAETHRVIVPHRNNVDDLHRRLSDATEVARDAAQLVQQLKDEQDAGYVFRKLRPVCCPACEAPVGSKDDAKSEIGDGCPLCKTDMPSDRDPVEERLRVAQLNHRDATEALNFFRTSYNNEERKLRNSEQEKLRIEARITTLLPQLDNSANDLSVKLLELEATARELRALLDGVRNFEVLGLHGQA
ncbi:UNVERIFIED_ORG: hypothetical protein BDU10_5526 [Burkholderia sp. CF145]